MGIAVSSWSPALSQVERLARQYQISPSDEMRACGCGIKLDLHDVVYPAFADPGGLPAGLGQRVDAFASSGRLEGFDRIQLELSGSAAEANLARLRAFRPNVALELLSLRADYLGAREETKQKFLKAFRAKTDFLVRLNADLGGSGDALTYGKGHSIRANGDFMMLDFLRVSPDSHLLTVANHDSIVTADSLVQPHCPVSVFTAFNNALNDLFLMGVTEGLKIFPAFDGDPEEVAVIRQACSDYAELFARNGVELAIEPTAPLGRGILVIGASVCGTSDRELPSLSGLKPGQRILVTRQLGDLSFLSMFRSRFFSGQTGEDWAAIRLGILQDFMTPNFPIAAVIRNFLPTLGEQARSDRHITFATDFSGPGIAVLEEAAALSGVGIRIDDLRFLDRRSLAFPRRNHTSSTNGPIALGVPPKIEPELLAALEAAGCSRSWWLGQATEEGARPGISVKKSLVETGRAGDPRADLFFPLVEFQGGAEVMPVFQSLQMH